MYIAVTLRLHLFSEIEYHFLLYLDIVPFKELHSLSWWKRFRVIVIQVRNGSHIVSEFWSVLKKCGNILSFPQDSILKIPGNFERDVETNAYESSRVISL